MTKALPLRSIPADLPAIRGTALLTASPSPGLRPGSHSWFGPCLPRGSHLWSWTPSLVERHPLLHWGRIFGFECRTGSDRIVDLAMHRRSRESVLRRRILNPHPLRRAVGTARFQMLRRSGVLPPPFADRLAVQNPRCSSTRSRSSLPPCGPPIHRSTIPASTRTGAATVVFFGRPPLSTFLIAQLTPLRLADVPALIRCDLPFPKRDTALPWASREEPARSSRHGEAPSGPRSPDGGRAPCPSSRLPPIQRIQGLL